jgi:hypothetical protein
MKSLRQHELFRLLGFPESTVDLLKIRYAKYIEKFVPIGRIYFHLVLQAFNLSAKNSMS